MEANELRIGNCIEKDGSQIIVKDLYLSSHIIQNKFYCINGIPISDLKPIPLTEEWHNKFGVIKNGFKSFEYVLKSNFNRCLTIIFTGDYVMMRQGINKSITDDVVSIWNKDVTKRDMYVHEWQNLYFVLTGEELKII